MNTPVKFAQLCSVLALAGAAAAAGAAQPIDRAAIQAQYRADRQACLSGNGYQPRATCLYDARLVRQAALAGRPLGDEQPAQLDANRQARCDRIDSGFRDNCMRLVQGEGTVVGSVAEGVIVRELITTDVASVDVPIGD